MKAMIRCLPVLVALLAPSGAQADVALSLSTLDRGTDEEKAFVRASIAANEAGLAAANDYLRNNGKPPIYCTPSTVKLTPERLIDILKRWINGQRAKAPHLDTVPVPNALLFALREAFPCK